MIEAECDYLKLLFSKHVERLSGSYLIPDITQELMDLLQAKNLTINHHLLAGFIFKSQFQMETELDPNSEKIQEIKYDVMLLSLCIVINHEFITNNSLKLVPGIQNIILALLSKYQELSQLVFKFNNLYSRALLFNDDVTQNAFNLQLSALFHLQAGFIMARKTASKLDCCEFPLPTNFDEQLFELFQLISQLCVKRNQSLRETCVEEAREFGLTQVESALACHCCDEALKKLSDYYDIKQHHNNECYALEQELQQKLVGFDSLFYWMNGIANLKMG
ncbi:Hypothetical_protein [Hexamita inflata]|uniref:Hypothetical_protein n=1 Tax=Hexamita inflata TaxID=28002 RepID=A0AA86R9J9_9EUKA|nr:Hypothetical protein HINF_LOCUS61984 [Hexamita inflata]